MSRTLTQDDLRALLDDLIEQARAVEAACYNRAAVTDEQRALLALDLDGARDRILTALSRAILPPHDQDERVHRVEQACALALEAGAPCLPDFNTTPNQLAALAACGVNTDPTQ